MRYRSLALLFLVYFLGTTLVSAQPKPAQNPPAPAQAPVEQQEPAQKSGVTIKIPVNLVDVLFTVLNRRNKLVPDLEKQDFKIFDDNIAQDIRYFSKQTDLPLRIGMLLEKRG